MVVPSDLEKVKYIRVQARLVGSNLVQLASVEHVLVAPRSQRWRDRWGWLQERLGLDLVL